METLLKVIYALLIVTLLSDVISDQPIGECHTDTECMMMHGGDGGL